MSIPLVLIGIAVATASSGVGLSILGVTGSRKGKINNRRANTMIERANASFEKAREDSKRAIENLGNQKIEVCNTSIRKFVSLFEQIKNIELLDSGGLQELSKFRIDEHGVGELKEMTAIAISLSSGVAAGSVTGGAVAFGAWNAAMAFGTASTGTAIGSLSGAAATNATLAFFGGGSLASGGLGMAGGMWVLGGLVVGPAIAILGTVLAAFGTADFYISKTNIEKAQLFQTEASVLTKACEGVRKRANLFATILVCLDIRFAPLLKDMEAVIRQEGTDYRMFSDKAKKTIAAALSFAQAVKAILDTPILSPDGKLTEESQRISNVICEQYRISLL